MTIDRRLFLAGGAALAASPVQAQSGPYHVPYGLNTQPNALATVALTLNTPENLNGLTGYELWKTLVPLLTLAGPIHFTCNARLVVARFASGQRKDLFMSKTFFFNGSKTFDDTLMPPAEFFVNDMFIKEAVLVNGTWTQGPIDKRALSGTGFVGSHINTAYNQAHVRKAMPNGYLFLAFAENSGFGCRTLNLVAERG